MRFAKLVTVTLACTIAGAACNPNDFDTALDRAPVVAFDNDSASGSLFVLPLSSPAPTGTVAARMLVSRKDSPYLVLAEYDKNGKVTLHKASDNDLNNLGNAPINSAAALSPDGPILLGTPRRGASGNTAPGGVSLLTLTTAADGSVSFAVQPGVQWADHFGISVVAGRITSLASTGEFVAVSDYGVQLLGADTHVIASAEAIPNTATSTICPNLDFTDPTAGSYAFRPLAVGDLIAGGGEEIVVSGLGRVVFLQYDAVKGQLQCLPQVLSQGAAVNFGASLAVADFDGDGNLDLAVGTPPDRVYVYFGPIATTGTPEVVTVVGPAGSALFGKRLASYPMPLGARLMVSDPSATVNGRSGAGNVVMLNVPRTVSVVDAASVTVSTLFDASSGSPTGVFGDSQGSLAFDTRVCNPAGVGVNYLPWSTSGTTVLTFFNYPGNVVGDLRCGN